MNFHPFRDFAYAGQEFFEEVAGGQGEGFGVVAGMEGAFGSVVGGLTKAPVIAVPTSVGYGANLGGISALLSMLNSCAAGMAVVNIDNGFGAGYMAAVINAQSVGQP